ncbi:hypothetical protein O181_025697 [Austropuccinia psidii MF-1]|uniref:Uncharacterized protein n=1 Tax=Austropuccinia psidii MF-1 TaxID=1389203 RepID=A0A9Q3H043_9BASI|nr:hypothetical protein [Austropuccinia psidii MF-1]
MAQTLENSTEFNELQTLAPESGSKISYMVSSHELGIEVESLEHESNPDPPVLPKCEHGFILNICSLSKHDTFVIAFISAQPPSSQKPNFKSYERERTVEPCAPTEDDVIFSGEVEIISKEPFVSNITQTIPRIEKIQNDSKIPNYVRQKIFEAMSLLKINLNCKGLGKRPNINVTKKANRKCCSFEAEKDSQDQGDDMMNVEVDHIDNEPPHTESPPYSMKQSMMNPLPPLLEILNLFKRVRQLNMIKWVKI